MTEISAPDDVILVLSTAPDEAVARQLARTLVERRLAACVNVGAPVWSVYRWRDTVEDAAEVPLAIKSTRGRQQALVAALQALHPYEVPACVVLPVRDGLPDYLDWVREQTR